MAGRNPASKAFPRSVSSSGLWAVWATAERLSKRLWAGRRPKADELSKGPVGRPWEGARRIARATVHGLSTGPGSRGAVHRPSAAAPRPPLASTTRGREGATRVAQYSKKFRMSMVQRMVGPDRVSATALAAEVGVPQPTLSRWLREAATVPAMKKRDQKKTDPPQNPAPRRPEDWTAEEKLRVVVEASRLDDESLGAFLRREGLHEALLAEWRRTILASLRPAPKRPRSAQGKEMKRLERELRRKEKALAETAALLVLAGKAEALWGAGGDDTKPKKGR